MEIPTLACVLLWVSTSPGYADSGVLIKSKYLNKFVTSSTLAWVGGEKGDHPQTAVIGSTEFVLDESMAASPVDLVDGDGAPEGLVERHVYVCRARLDGVDVPGQLRYGKRACQVSFHDKVSSHEIYEVLENVENGGRLTWVKWNRFSGEPVGAVYAGEYYIARRLYRPDSGELPQKGTGLKHLMGKLRVESEFGHLSIISPDEKMEEHNDGEVLVETEPIRYELTSIQFDYDKQRTVKNPRVLRSIQLRNDKSEEPARLDTVIEYSTNYSNYWGQGRAILKGLLTIVRLNKTVFEEIKWGIEESEARNDVHRVESHLEPGTGVNVTLYGNDTETETPYTAKLVAVYEDGASRARTIKGIRREVEMRDVTPEFSQPFFLGNMSLVPTTTTTTTTTTKATTISSTMLTPTKKPHTGENGISSATSGKKSENSSMMNDEGAETAKKQETQGAVEDQGPNSTAAQQYQSLHQVLLFVLPSFALLLHRIT